MPGLCRGVRFNWVGGGYSVYGEGVSSPLGAAGVYARGGAVSGEGRRSRFVDVMGGTKHVRSGFPVIRVRLDGGFGGVIIAGSGPTVGGTGRGGMPCAITRNRSVIRMSKRGSYVMNGVKGSSMGLAGKAACGFEWGGDNCIGGASSRLY